MTSQRASSLEVTRWTCSSPAACATKAAARTARADARTKRTRCGWRGPSRPARSLFLRSWRVSIDRFFPSLVWSDRQGRGHDPPAVHVVDDIDTIVLPVRPCDTEKEGCPAPEAELPFLGQRAPEDELVALTDEVGAGLLADAVDVDLERGADAPRQGHTREFRHRHSMPIRGGSAPRHPLHRIRRVRVTLRAVLLAVPIGLATAATAAAGNGGVAPVQSHSPNTAAIRDTYWLILAVTGVIFVLVEGALLLFVV